MSLKDQIVEAMWDGDVDRLWKLAPCDCCCDEHTFSNCPARLWGGCRGGSGSKTTDYEAWAAHYNMGVDEFLDQRKRSSGADFCAGCGTRFITGEEITEYGRGENVERFHYPHCPRKPRWPRGP